MTKIKKLAIGTDCRGEEIARQVVNILAALDYSVLLLSTGSQTTTHHENSSATVEDIDLAGSHDYPDEAFRVANAIAHHDADSGILVSCSAIGMCITANKCPGIRAVVAHDEWVVRRSRAHHNCNILCIPAGTLGQSDIKGLLETWLNTPFEGGRHERRINKISQVERGENPAESPVGS